MLGDDIADALPELQAEAESRMRDTCVITRPDPFAPENWNPATLQYEPGETTIYEGKCRLRDAGTIDRTANAADQPFTLSQSKLSLPIAGSVNVQKDDKVVIAATVAHPALILWIDARSEQSAATARRFPVRETQ